MTSTTSATRVPIETSVVAREELVVGLIGAIGTDLDSVERILEELLKEYGYACERFRVSALIRTIPAYGAVTGRRDYDYYNRMIDGGNAICKALKDKGALADLTVEAIRDSRGAMASIRRRAFVIHSLKRPEEVARLREIYGGLFYAVAIHADAGAREDRLTRRFNEELGRPDDPEGRYSAQRLMRRDEREEEEWGQKVSDTFAQADYFVRSDDEAEVRRSLDRFLTLVFGKPYLSPTRAEVAMMHAFSAGLRSADLSRQIGAAIAARDGRILTTGCNEVPRPGGGQYWAGDRDDNRDFRRGHDINDVKKRDTIVELLRLLDSIIMPEQYLDGLQKLYQEIDEKGLLAGSRVDSLIEFGRVSHAEMSALNEALLEAISVRDADLFCTTFPCHMCTRLIIGAGIRNVFYIEPYPKSAAMELYGNTEIRVNPTLAQGEYVGRQTDLIVEDKRTYFVPFEGVAPRRYQELFTRASKWKNRDGSIVGFDPLVARPRRTPSFVAIHRVAEHEIAESIHARAQGLRDASVTAEGTKVPEP